jgi:hypothetical protein
MIGNLLLPVFGAVAKLQHWQFSEIVLTVALLFLFITWVIVFVEMIKNKIHNKIFWILCMFLLPFISAFVYLFRREKLLAAI